jgi:hypothetical protein
MSAPGVRLSDKAVNFVAPGRHIRPRGDYLIVKPLPLTLSERLKADWHGEVVRGRVIAAGPGCYKNIHRRGVKDGKPWRTVRQSQVFTPNEVQVGDIVQLGGMEIEGYLFPKVWVSGDWCVICREEDVCFIECKP